jgi:protein-tyrosine-phosphatase
MAESIARGIGRDRVVAQSAGLAPAGFVADLTVSTLSHLGYPVDGLYSKGLDAVETSDLDIVVSLIGSEIHYGFGCGPAARRINWPVPDPFGEDDSTYLRVARDIEAKVRNLLEVELSLELLQD